MWLYQYDGAGVDGVVKSTSLVTSCNAVSPQNRQDNDDLDHFLTVSSTSSLTQGINIYKLKQTRKVVFLCKWFYRKNAAFSIVKLWYRSNGWFFIINLIFSFSTGLTGSQQKTGFILLFLEEKRRFSCGHFLLVIFFINVFKTIQVKFL